MRNRTYLSSFMFSLSLLTLSAIGCGGEADDGGDGGGGGDDGGGGDGDGNGDPPPCQAVSCGKESFRRALPTRQSVMIDFQRASARELPAGTRPAGRVGARHPRAAQLEDVAPAYIELGEHVDEVNGTVEDLFAGLEELSAGEPEIEEDTVHQWRIADPDVPGTEEVLTLETDDEATFSLSYAAGPAGFEPAEDSTFMTGTINVVDGEQGEFEFALDFDVASAIFADLGVTGVLEVSSHAFDGGAREIWYDFTEFGEIGGDLETSLTTYWTFDDGSGALEYLDALYDSQATVYARWDDTAGRYDYHVAWLDDVYGELDEISTSCWGGEGAESFWASAVIDESLNYYVEMDGDEADCEFAPLDGHPDPGKEFADLPAEGEWDELLADSAPYCEDDPDDPDCIYYCDLFPEAC